MHRIKADGAQATEAVALFNQT
jgi:hypothetical protein